MLRQTVALVNEQLFRVSKHGLTTDYCAQVFDQFIQDSVRRKSFSLLILTGPWPDERRTPQCVERRQGSTLGLRSNRFLKYPVKEIDY